MEKSNKVFYTDIIRGENQTKNNLYDLLNITQATPLILKEPENSLTCKFIPKTDKVFIPKRRPKVKVKTVRDIRTYFENDTYAYLTKDLEIQQKYVLKKITCGSAKQEKTIDITKKIFKADFPISRTTWHMLNNINPYNHRNNRQFVLWNGKFIQVNGSTGGKSKLICNYDIACTKLPSKITKKYIQNSHSNKKKGLLRNSLDIKFKPGPLRKKKFLDDSFQRHNGDIELIDLPRVGLEIEPLYGTKLDSTITSFLSNLYEDNGKISEKWADFSVSVLGKIEQSEAKLLSRECVTFELNYKYDQHRILMRKDLESDCVTKGNTSVIDEQMDTDQLTILPVVKSMMAKILDAVEINVNQDNIFKIDNDTREMISEVSNANVHTTFSKERNKRKYCELGRLDVTVIQLLDNTKKEFELTCCNSYCTLGCICHSLKRKENFREHCGREECMFDCKCDFSNYSNFNSFDLTGSNFLPGIKGIENAVNAKLAKEEQKFHQTVIVTGKKNILLKSEKRNCKPSKKIRNFDENIYFKSNQNKPILSVTVLKINCQNVEPWCLVHNLYKCFCKGKFIESNISTLNQKLTEGSSDKDTNTSVENILENVQQLSNAPVKKCLRPRALPNTLNGNKTTKTNALGEKSKIPVNRDKVFQRTNDSDCYTDNEEWLEIAGLSTVNNYKKPTSENNDLNEYYLSNYIGTCSRVSAYEGRKYSNGHYKNTNDKIKELENNDEKLQQKMLTILQPHYETEQHVTVKKNKDMVTAKDSLLKDQPSKSEQTQIKSQGSNFVKFLYDIDGVGSENEVCRKILPSQNKLVTWLESYYKIHKKRIDEGLVKTSLETPKPGKVTLYAWDFILSRYRERKNLFLISKQKPYRIFMGVNTKDPFLQSCMNINEIRFADLHKYPQTVKNLLTNATDLKDNFCILRGATEFWELVGSVAKINRSDQNAIRISEEFSSLELNCQNSSSDIDIGEEEFLFNSSDKDDIKNKIISSGPKESEILTDCSDEADSSKWFVMTIENDFSEIRFYKKGFFVKYESILKAIHVARISGKAVRLSSQKCVDKNIGPQFGVYAIPNASEYCVFIGPYEIRDSLGIETMKTILDVRKTKSTRGFWITTNKVDNLKIIDNPMSFMPLTELKNKDTLSIENHFCDDKNTSSAESTSNYLCSDDSDSVESPTKHDSKQSDDSPTKEFVVVNNSGILKPIKIQSHSTYQLTKSGLLKKISLLNPNKLLTNPSTCLRVNSDNLFKPVSVNKNMNIQQTTSSISEDATIKDGPLLKITAVYSQTDGKSSKCEKKLEKGMFILKPEEINRKLMERQMDPKRSKEQNPVYDDEISQTEASGMDSNSENSKTFTASVSNTDVCVISDDESDVFSEITNISCWKDVFIECTNITDQAWILGRQMLGSRLLSFKIPGGEYSAFYSERDALVKLNEELSKMLGPSCSINLQWKVVDATDEIISEASLTDIVFWQRVLKNKGKAVSTNLLKTVSIKTYSKKNTVSTSAASASITVSDGETVLPDTALPNIKDQNTMDPEELSD